MKLIITEKPSVAKDVARVLGINKNNNGYMSGNDYYITWCVGHLIQLAMPEEYDTKLKSWNMDTLPIFPQKFKYTINEATKQQYETVKALMHRDDVNEIICATDAGREGQLIFGYVYINAQCTKPVKRLWISSMTDEAIKEGFNTLKDNKEYYLLYQSAKSRSEADWLVGINATRMYSVKYNEKLTIGRVQTPTLAMIVQRQNEIDCFTPEPFYEVQANTDNFSATWFNEDGTRLKQKEKAEEIIKKCENKDCTVTKVSKKKATTERPLLYDLTELQRDGNKKYGYTAEQTLEAAQSLYEKYKLTTYPRTDSRFLSTDMKPKLKGLLLNIRAGYKLSEKCVEKVIAQGLNTDKRVIDDKKITDHHAIIVTDNIRNLANIKLPEKEKNILKLVIARFIVALDKKQEYEQTDIEIISEGETFKTRGKKITVPGWKETEDILLGKSVNTEDEEDEGEIKNVVKKNDKLLINDMKLLEKKTSPPKLYTEATLLTAMETAGKQIEDEELRDSMKSIGLGTPATRASIIEKLVSVGYIKRNKKNLIPTENGKKLIEIVPEKLKKPDLTGEWEQSLNKITSGDEQAKNFIVNIKKYVYDIIKEGRYASTKNVRFTSENSKYKKESFGRCPICGNDVYSSEKGYYCSAFRNYPKCNFGIWKSNKAFADNNIELSGDIVKKLLEEKQTVIDTEAGQCTIRMNVNNKYYNFIVEKQITNNQQSAQ